MISKSIVIFAATNGYDGVKLLDIIWDGWRVYNAYMTMLSEANTAAPGTGYPQFILEKNGKIRWADSLDETFAIMDMLSKKEVA